MRYWFDEIKNTAFALDVPPPDGAGVFEIEEDDFKTIMAAQAAPSAVQPESAPSPAILANMEDLARVWRKMQNARDVITSEAAKADAEIKAEQTQVGAALLDAMNKMGGMKLLTAAGQIEKKKKTRANPKDWAAIWRFIEANKAYGLVHKRLTDTFVEEWAKTHDGELPPGIDVFTKWEITVKKPGTKDVPSSED